MSAKGYDPNSFAPGGEGGNVRPYNTHTHNTSNFDGSKSTFSAPVYTSGGGGVGGTSAGGGIGAPMMKYVSYETELGRYPAMTSCASCQQQVMTNVTYKAGTYAWIMCLVFILCGLVLLCCLIPFFVKHFKDAYHSCPRCNRILHVEKKQCC